MIVSLCSSRYGHTRPDDNGWKSVYVYTTKTIQIKENNVNNWKCMTQFNLLCITVSDWKQGSIE